MKTQVRTKRLGGMVLVTVVARTWGARKKAKAGEVEVTRHAASEAAPKGLFTDPQKHLIDQTKLQAFNTLMNRLTTELDREGIRAYGGWLIPASRLNAVTRLVEEIEAEYDAAKANLIANVETLHDEWVAAVPNWADTIRTDAAEMKADIERQVVFAATLEKFEVSQEPEAKNDEDVGVTGPKGRLYTAVAEIADQTIRKVLEGKESIVVASTVHLKKIRSKFAAMGMLDPREHPMTIVKTIDALLLELPDKGTVSGPLFQKFLRLFWMFRDPVATQQTACRIGKGEQTISQFLESLVPAEPEPAPIVATAAAPAPAATVSVPAPTPLIPRPGPVMGVHPPANPAAGQPSAKPVANWLTPRQFNWGQSSLIN